MIIKDKNLERMIRKIINKPEGEIYQSDLLQIIELNLTDYNISDISSLSGLKNLIYLNLGYNNISDVSALSGLTNLNYIDISKNNISDVNHLSNLKAKIFY